MSLNSILHSEDGSHTVLSEKFSVTYHSKFGAIDESMTVFINAGYHYFDPKQKSKLNIFEMGFGTGLNPLLTLRESKKDNREISYTGIEAYPISRNLVNQLNYPEILGNEYKHPLSIMHGTNVNLNIDSVNLSENFLFSKIIADILTAPLEGEYDIIYYDAFGPTSQPILWEEAHLTKLFNITANGGVLVTYCAKGSFKRALKKVGYTVENLPGPRGKREMTRAIKKTSI